MSNEQENFKLSEAHTSQQIRAQMAGLPQQTWQDIVHKKREVRQKQVEPFLNYVNGESAQADKITAVSGITDLTDILKSGNCSARDVIRHYARR